MDTDEHGWEYEVEEVESDEEEEVGPI